MAQQMFLQDKERGRKMNKSSISIIKKDLCFKSLAFCCGLEKKCDIRNKVMRKLGITIKEYKKLKREMDRKFNKLVKL